MQQQSKKDDGRMCMAGMGGKKTKKTRKMMGENGEDNTKCGAAVGFLIRIIQGEMAPGLGEISAAFSRITPGTIRTQSCLMSPTHPSCM